MLKKRMNTVNSLFRPNGVLGSSYDLNNLDNTATASLLKTKYPNGIKGLHPKVVAGKEAYCVKCGNAISAKHELYCNACLE